MSNYNILEWYDDQPKDSLKLCSYDDSNDEYLISSDLKAINFDKVKTDFCRESTTIKSLKSAVALYLHSEHTSIYLFEFKNAIIEKEVDSKSVKSKIKILEIKEKIYDSYFILKQKKLQNFTNLKLRFILVYNGEKNPDSKVGISNHLARKSNKTFVRFGLNKFNGYLYDDVFTMTADIFEKFVDNGFIMS